MPNPFAYGSRITDPARFVGRTAELRRIFSTLDTIHTRQLQSVSVVGPRRIGKSSLLFHIYQTYQGRIASPERFVVAYADLESGQYSTLDGLLKGILACLHESTSSEHFKLRRALDNAANDKATSLSGFESAIKTFQTAESTPLYPVLCLDEFENLTEHPTVFKDTFYDSLRSLMNASQLALVIGSAKPLHKIKEQSEKLTSPFFNIFSEFIELGELTDTEARILIEWGKTCDRPFTPDDCRQVLALAGNHPLRIQLAGSLVYAAKEHGVVNWHEVEKGFEQRAQHIFAFERRKKWTFQPILLLTGFGSMINNALGRPHNDEKSNLMSGITAFLVVLLGIILIRFFPQLVELWLRLMNN